MKTTWESVPYDEIDVPNRLYKFRVWRNDYHKTILRDRLVYLSPPSGFEDPLDCKIPIRYDLRTHREQNKRFFEESVRRHPSWSKKRHKNWAKKWMKRTPLRNPRKLKSIMGLWEKKFDNRLGVLSLTPEVDNFEMWESNYAEKHEGFCIGFDGKAMLSDDSRFGMSGPVEYYTKLPIIHPDEYFLKKAEKQTFSKLSKWSFEKEYRTTKLRPDGEVGDDWRKVKVPDDRIIEVVFGAKMQKAEKEEITRFVHHNLPHVKLRQAEIDVKNRTVIIKDL